MAHGLHQAGQASCRGLCHGYRLHFCSDLQHRSVAIVALVAISACMSLMFPTIYGIALNGIGGDSAKIAASGLIMAILGGASLTPLQALVSDVCGISYSFAVPLLCFAVVLAYAAGIIMRTAKARSERGCGISNP